MPYPPSQSPGRLRARPRHRHHPYPGDTYHSDHDASYNNGYYRHPEPYASQGAFGSQYHEYGGSQSDYESAYYGSGYQDQYYQSPQADWTSSNTAFASSSSAYHAPYRPMTSAFAQSLSHSQPHRPYSTSTARYAESHSQSYARGAPSEPPSSSPPFSQPELFAAKPFFQRPSQPKLISKDRPRRSPSPPSPAPTPSPAYLATAHTPSTRLADPTAVRRLLVLDLNGTLLLRSMRRPATRDAPPPPRKVHPRPYLPSLRAYLAHARTREWLDVMVWSSAQPHNVADMVHKAFGADDARLVAVWARDTLGLAPDRYHRKVQTVKDLAKPWLELARLSSPAEDENETLPSASQPSPPVQKARAQAHSAETTLLLDDSVRKAALQPYNHVCIREYTQAVRGADLRALAAATRPDRGAEIEIEDEDEDEDEDGRKRRRKEKKVRKMAERRAAAEAEAEAAGDVDETRETPSEPEPALDETLVAVIGILHAVRWESNVAGWIFSGALWGPYAASANEEGESKAGNDALSSSAREEAEVGEEGEEPAETAAPLWFEREEVVTYWAKRGREALEELGLEVVHGING